MNDSKVGNGGSLDADELAARLKPTFEAILEETHGRQASISRVEGLLVALPEQFLAEIDRAGFDLVRRTQESR